MSLGLVSYGDSDDEEDQERQKNPPQKAPPSVIPPQSGSIRPDFRRPPPPLFPGANSQPVPARKAPVSTYSQLVERDERGRVRVTAPRVDDHDSDEEDDGRQFKKPKSLPNTSNPGSTGLMAVLPRPEGPKKKGEVAKDFNSSFDQMLSRKKKDTNSTETIKVQGASQIRYEAEMKRAQLLQKYLKKAEVIEPDDDNDDGTGSAATHAYHPPGEPDYLGLNARALGNVRFAEPVAPGSGGADGNIEWEVDESAYEDDYNYGHHPPPPVAPDHSGPPLPPAFGPQPGQMWTANYKYQDVQNILENPRAMGYAPPPGLTADHQVERLIARHEPDFQEFFNMGNRINIVDVRADDHLGNPRENVMRQLTEQEANPPSRPMVVKGKVNRTARAKGQITYLAAQAVARETELQNEWSRNRQARTAAANRYGF